MEKLKVGASKKAISPKQDMMPYPEPVVFGNGRYTWVRKEICVRAIAIDSGERRLLFLIQELVSPCNTGRIKEIIAGRHGIEPECVFISCTHNHSAPPPIELSMTEEWGVPVPPVRYRYSEYVIDQSIAAASVAFGNMRPARLGYGQGNSYINVNRDECLESGRHVEGRSFERPSDKTLAILKFEDLQGKLIAALMNYSVHSVMCFRVKDKDGNLCVSGDLAGEITDFVEGAYSQDGAVVAWTIGAGGNQNPLLSCFHNYHADGTYEMTRIEWNPVMWELAHHLGQRQGIDAIRIMKGISELRDEARIDIVDRMISLPGTKVEGFTQPMIMNANLIDDSKIHNVDADPVPLALKLITLGDIAVFGLNCELMCEIGMRLKEKSPLKNTILISLYENGASGKYLVDKWGYEHRTFAYYRNRVKNACTEEKVREAMLEMFDERFGT